MNLVLCDGRVPRHGGRERYHVAQAVLVRVPDLTPGRGSRSLVAGSDDLNHIPSSGGVPGCHVCPLVPRQSHVAGDPVEDDGSSSLPDVGSRCEDSGSEGDVVPMIVPLEKL